MELIWDHNEPTPRCGRPSDLPVLFSSPDRFEYLTGPDYPNRKTVHVHEFPSRRCSLIVTAKG